MTQRAHKWRQLVLSEQGPSSATTRYLLVFLSFRMKGDVCQLTPREIAEGSLLDRRTVVAHLKRAAHAGWLARRQMRRNTRGWRRMEYLPWWPALGRFHAELADGESAPA